MTQSLSGPSAFVNSRPRILVVGDLMLDEYIRGECTRLCPEAPVPVVSAVEREVSLGGAGNVAANVAALGGQAELVAVVAADARGLPDPEVVALLGRNAVVATGLVATSDRRTTRKTRVFAGPQQIVRIDDERVVIPGEEMRAVLVKRALGLLAEADLLVISDYGKGALEPSMLRTMIRAARARGIPVLVDPGRQDVARYAGASLLTPNAEEARRAAGGHADWAAITAWLLERSEADAVAVTCGADGIVLRARGEEAPVHHPTRARPARDTVGAGDTVLAALAVALASGLALAEAVKLANVAAGIAVGKPGTATVHRAELAVELARELGHPLDIDDAAEFAQVMRAQGRRLVFTNGCFDLLHAGHLHVLDRARALGDALIVGLNADESVRLLKGPERPVQPAAVRARVLLGLRAVDAVVLIDTPTPAALVARLLPDVLVKGGDYRAEDVVGRNHAREVVTVPLLPNHSTSAILRAIRDGRRRSES